MPAMHRKIVCWHTWRDNQLWIFVTTVPRYRGVSEKCRYRNVWQIKLSVEKATIFQGSNYATGMKARRLSIVYERDWFTSKQDYQARARKEEKKEKEEKKRERERALSRFFAPQNYVITRNNFITWQLSWRDHVLALVPADRTKRTDIEVVWVWWIVLRTIEVWRNETVTLSRW